MGQHALAVSEPLRIVFGLWRARREFGFSR